MDIDMLLLYDKIISAYNCSKSVYLKTCSEIPLTTKAHQKHSIRPVFTLCMEKLNKRKVDESYRYFLNIDTHAFKSVATSSITGFYD